MKSETQANEGLPAGACSPRRFVRMFKPQFAEMVARGAKCQTIRPTPKRLPEPGDLISLRAWTGQPYRSKQRVLREATVEKTIPVSVTEDGIFMCGLEMAHPDEFARADGFDDVPCLIEWFRKTHGLPFHGVVIYWENVKGRATTGAEEKP